MENQLADAHDSHSQAAVGARAGAGSGVVPELVNGQQVRQNYLGRGKCGDPLRVGSSPLSLSPPALPSSLPRSTSSDTMISCHRKTIRISRLPRVDPEDLAAQMVGCDSVCLFLVETHNRRPTDVNR